MKTLLVQKQILILLIVLTLAQFSCNFGAKVSTNGVQEATQPPVATGAPQAAPTVATTNSAHGTPAEAQAMLKAALAHYLAVGRDQALKGFTNRVPPFFQGDLYVACIDSSLVQSANGGFPNLVGSRVQPLSRARWDAATATKIDSISYSYIDPVTGINTAKTLYYEKVGTDVCGVGAYNP